MGTNIAHLVEQETHTLKAYSSSSVLFLPSHPPVNPLY